ncbi:MAG: hypothetical protein IT431_14010 [Phycisphaerales bacterium]|nr:hypothetical protein [Phycisphaerales bacterium]
MPSPSDRETPDLRSLTPEPVGEAPAAFLAAVRARRRVVRSQRLSLAAVAVAVGLVAWRVGPWAGGPTPTDPTGGGPRLVETGEPAPGGSEGQMTLASLRRLYAGATGEGEFTLPELPRLVTAGPGEPPLRLMDTDLLLSGGV